VSVEQIRQQIENQLISFQLVEGGGRGFMINAFLCSCGFTEKLVPTSISWHGIIIEHEKGGLLGGGVCLLFAKTSAFFFFLSLLPVSDFSSSPGSFVILLLLLLWLAIFEI
jgi:hypothetical protein